MKKFFNIVSIIFQSITEGRAQATLASKKYFGINYH